MTAASPSAKRRWRRRGCWGEGGVADPDRFQPFADAHTRRPDGPSLALERGTWRQPFHPLPPRNAPPPPLRGRVGKGGETAGAANNAASSPLHRRRAYRKEGAIPQPTPPFARSDRVRRMAARRRSFHPPPSPSPARGEGIPVRQMGGARSLGRTDASCPSVRHAHSPGCRHRTYPQPCSRRPFPAQRTPSPLAGEGWGGG